MVDSSILIALVIIAITQMIKMASPKVNGWITILIAFVVAIVISVLSFVLPTDVIGIAHVSLGAAIVSALTAIGITVAASKAGGGAAGDNGTVVRR